MAKGNLGNVFKMMKLGQDTKTEIEMIERQLDKIMIYILTIY